MNDEPKLYEEFYELHLYLQNNHTRNSRFNHPTVGLDVERNLTIFQSISVLMLLLHSFVCLCLTMLSK